MIDDNDVSNQEAKGFNEARLYKMLWHLNHSRRLTKLQHYIILTLLIIQPKRLFIVLTRQYLYTLHTNAFSTKIMSFGKSTYITVYIHCVKFSNQV